MPEIGPAKRGVIRELLNEQENGAKLILWTCREGKQLHEAIRWCVEEGLVFDAVNDNLQENKEFFGNDSRKIYASEYWDDKNVMICGDDVRGYQYHPPKKRWRDKLREILRILKE